MNYETALKLWGASKLETYRNKRSKPVDVENVIVKMDFNEGYACCGGTDPDCYCSFAESPSANVIITDGNHAYAMDADDFDFVTVLREIVEIGGGSLS